MVELTNTVFVNSTNITTNIETTVLSIFFSTRQGNCPSQVCTCRSRTRNTDECEIARAKSDKYYLVLYVDKDHVDLKLSIEAFNLKAVYPITE